MQLEDIDLLDRDAFTRGVPHEWFTFLRKNRPIHRHPEPNGPGFWVVSKHADVEAVGRDPVTYSSDQDRGGVGPLEEPANPREAAIRPPKILLTMDPPEHTRYRNLVSHGFTNQIIRTLEPRIREAAVRILDAAIKKRTVDFVVDVAAELPVEVIAEIIGVPHEDRHKIFDWTNRMVGVEDPEYFVSENQTTEAMMEMFVYVHQLAEERRKERRDDVMSVLIDAEIDGDKLNEMELDAFFLMLSAAGNETTRNAISHGLNAFLDHPEEYEKLVQEPERVIRTATEEVLRWSSPVLYFKRNVTRDTELRGQEIKAGDKVSVWFVSANRDEEVFEDPFRFDIERNPNRHLAFGGGGPHFCLGASLARLEIRLIFEELARRVPVLRRLGRAEPLRSNMIGGIKHLPVDLSAALHGRTA